MDTREALARQLRRYINEEHNRNVSAFIRVCQGRGEIGRKIGSSIRKMLRGEGNPSLERMLFLMEVTQRSFSYFTAPDASETAPYYPTREEINLGLRFREAKQQIDILTTRLTNLTEERSPRSFIAEIEHAIEHNAVLQVRVLVMSPQGNYAKTRGEQLDRGGQIYKYREELTTALNRVRETAFIYKKQFKGQLFESDNSIILHRIDSSLIVSPIPLARPSHKSCSVELKTYWKGASETYLKDHFDELWDPDKNENVLDAIPREVQDRALARQSHKSEAPKPE